MMRLAEINFKSLIDRVDANFYVIRLGTIQQLHQQYKNLGDLCNFPRTKTPPKELYFRTGIPVIKLKNVSNYFLQFKDTDYIPQSNYSEFVQPKRGDILITATGEGTIGRVGIFENDIKCIVTAEVMIVRPRNINPYFLFAYLRSSYGHYQLERFVRGSTGQTHLYSKDVALIPVPQVSERLQKEIEELVKQAHQKKKLADEKYEEANKLLLKELGLHDLVITEQKFFEVKFSETKERIDADYYKPEYKTIDDLIQQNEKRGLFKLQKLSNVCMLKKGIEVGSEAYTKEGILFLRVSNISETGLTEGESSEYITPFLFEQIKEEYAVKENDILYTKDATIGVALVADKDFPSSIPSMGVVRLQSKGIDPYYIALALNSIACRSQSNREVIGAVIKHYNFTKLKNLLVPIVPKQKQENIAELVKQSFSLRKEAKQLLDEATKRVKEIIE